MVSTRRFLYRKSDGDNKIIHCKDADVKLLNHRHADHFLVTAVRNLFKVPAVKGDDSKKQGLVTSGEYWIYWEILSILNIQKV